MKRLNQAIPKEQKLTIADFMRRFPDDAACLHHIFLSQWADGIVDCVTCKAPVKHHPVSGRKCYACQNCGTQVSPLVGTIFEKSCTSLKLWFYAMYLMSATRCGISAKQLQRETGVTYKTAWRMFKQIRTLMGEDIKLSGNVEVDETYCGGTRKGKTGRPMKGDTKKTAVVGMVERNGKIIARTVPEVSGSTLLNLIKDNVNPLASIFTDEWKGYSGVSHITNRFYSHETIKHADSFVNGRIHTNTVEGFWSLVKGGIRGVYRQVGNEYLQSYLNEYTFRYNHRRTPRPMFLCFWTWLASLHKQCIESRRAHRLHLLYGLRQRFECWLLHIPIVSLSV